ncbi:Ycf66 family protein [Phormidesmis sp. 146-35]
MVNFQLNFASLSGLALVYLGLKLLLFAQSSRPVRVAAIVLAVFLLISSVIFVLYGWRFDPIMQIGQILMTLTSAYWVLKQTRR